MTKHLPLRYICALLTALMVLSSCSSSSIHSTGDSETSPPVKPAGDMDAEAIRASLPARVSEQDVEEARAAIDMARMLWEQEGPSSYQVLSGDTVASISVDELFDGAEQLIVQFEQNPSLTPDPGDCADHFAISFDPDLGYPRSYDTFSPCEDAIAPIYVVEELS